MSARWWEYYVLRYFVGTVVGAIAAVYLTKLADSPFHGHDFPSLDDLGSPALKIAVLGALGFAFCYIASTPMLMIHSTRAQFGLNPLGARWRFWAFTALLIAMVHGAMVLVLSLKWWGGRSLGALVFLVVVGIQVALIVDAHRNRFKAIRSFYWDLAQARAKAVANNAGPNNPGAVREYVESYRHLREHGNAVAILILEFGLAFVLVAAQQPTIRNVGVGVVGAPLGL